MSAPRAAGTTASILRAGVLAILATASAVAGVHAQAAPVSFTAAQAEQGKALFEQNCARCHRADLSGNPQVGAPALEGPDFRSAWGNKPASGLLEFVAGNMPIDVPGSLDAPTYAAVVAYLMSASGAKPGAAELKADSPGLFIPGP